MPVFCCWVETCTHETWAPIFHVPLVAAALGLELDPSDLSALELDRDGETVALNTEQLQERLRQMLLEQAEEEP